jgi:hypothetical protein
MSPSTAEPAADAGREAILLDDHHVRLERICTELLSDAYADDPRALCARWREFETEIRDHMSAEEDLILPAYERAAPAEARAIREDHRRLREVLQRLGVEVELHQIRLRTVRELLDHLRAHADREDAAMYPWAAAHKGTLALAALRARIERWLADAGVTIP